MEPQPAKLEPFEQILVAVVAAITILTMALVALSFPAGLYTVFATSLSNSYSASTAISGIFIFIGPLTTAVPLPGTMGTLFLALCLVYAAMFLLAAMQGRRISSAFKRAFTEGFSAFFSNNLLVTLLATGFLAFTVLVVDSVETAGGIPIGSISGDPMELLLSLTVAPLREEFGFRMLMIGPIAALVALAVSRRAAPRALWRPSVCYEESPNFRTLAIVALGFGLFASSIVFGLAHIESNSGWEIGKLPEAAYAGVVLGYLYIKYGFHVAVLTHWGIDYFGSVFSLYGQGAYGIPWDSNSPFILQQLVNVDLLFLMGVASFLVVIYVGLQKIVRSRAEAAVI